jgi:signal transduction histidine kinase
MDDWLKQQDNLLSLVMHEIRGPLSMMLNSSYLLKNSCLDSPDSQRNIEIIERQVRKLDEIMNSIAILIRCKLGKQPIRKCRISSTQLIEESLDICQANIQIKGIEVEVTGAKKDIFIFGSSRLLCQALVNLIENAVKFSSCSSIIEISKAIKCGKCLITVRDNGIGMRYDQAKSVFDPYVQSTTTAGGLGLGLFIVKEIVELHGGKVEVHSEGVGKGSEFRILIPTAKDS